MILTDMCRSGKTPEEQVKQILAVAPILPGQNSSNANSPPAQHHTEAAAPKSEPEPKPEPKQETPVAVASERPQIQTQTTSLNGAAPNPEIQNLLQSTGHPASTTEGPLADFHKDLVKDLEAARDGGATPKPGQLRREDTDDSVDEFVDAEG